MSTTALYFQALPERTFLLKNEHAKGCKIKQQSYGKKMQMIGKNKYSPLMVTNLLQQGLAYQTFQWKPSIKLYYSSFYP